jgi:hypothetical protein
MSFRQYTPAVPRHWLFIVIGTLWSAVGVVLCSLAVHWLSHSAGNVAWWLGALGVALAAVMYRFMFLKLARKNIGRIEQRPARTCFFAFQPWRSYGLMLFMIALGITLRHSHTPRHYLAVIYAAVGSALFLASLSYHASFWRERSSYRSQPHAKTH